MSVKIKELEKKFMGRGEVSGYEFTQFLRTASAYIYQVKHSDGTFYYEIFKRKVKSGKYCWQYK